MKPMEEKQPTMQNHANVENTHQEKPGCDTPGNDDHHPHHQQQQQQQQQQQKRPNESNNEEKVEKKSSDHNNNGGVLGPRERMKRHRREVAGQVWIPDMWGQEDFLKDWIDCSAFDASLVHQNIMLARASLMGQGRRSSSNTLTVENSC